jgi:hypothetical protein
LVDGSESIVSLVIGEIGHLEAILGELGKLGGRKGKVFGQGLVLVGEAVAEGEGVVGTERATDALVEEATNGMLFHFPHNLKLEVADGAEVEGGIDFA